MIIFFIVLAVIITLIIGFYLYRIRILRNVMSMTATEMLENATKKVGKYIAVATIEDGEIVNDVYGNNDTKRLDFDYEIGSLSKTMLALLVSKAVDEEKLKLSDSISKYLDLPKDKYFPTLERMMTHTSGYKNYYMNKILFRNIFKGGNSFYGVNKEQLLKEVGAVTLKDMDYPFLYSNFAISIVGLVLEAVYQKDYTTLLNEYLHNELHMENTTVATGKGNLSKYWRWNKDDGYIPAGSVISNITDITKYLQFIMTTDEPYVLRTLTPVKNITNQQKANIKMGIRIDKIALTWIHDIDKHLIWHNGGTSNYNSYLAISEDRTRGIVMLSNSGPANNIPACLIGVKLFTNVYPLSRTFSFLFYKNLDTKF